MAVNRRLSAQSDAHFYDPALHAWPSIQLNHTSLDPSTLISIANCGLNVIPYSPVVRIPGFHPGGPGSIPGVGNSFFCPVSISIVRVGRF